MANTPFTGVEDSILLIKLKIDGNDINESYAIQSVKVTHAINKISVADIVLKTEVGLDSGEIEITDSDDLNPGKTVEIQAGYINNQPATIFKGIIVKHTVKLDSDSGYTFSIECKHEAVKMPFNEKERFYENHTDDAIIKNIISDYGFTCNVNACAETNESTFQKMSTDWNFILAKSEFNGMLISLDGSSDITVLKPDFSSTPLLTIEAGDSIISFEGTLNAEYQPAAVNASAWDSKTLALIHSAATEPSVNAQGKIKPRDLPAKLSQTGLNLISPTPITTAALKTWADGVLLRKRLSAFKGNVKYIGNALAKTGSIIELTGVGKKLSGMAFVSGVTHTIVKGEWSTSVLFGLEDKQINESPAFSHTTAAGRLPAMQGLQLATVKKIDSDPDNNYRIQVEIPSGSTIPNTTWARMSHFKASNTTGSFFLPEIGDEVVLGFLDSDPGYPVILGALYSSKNAAPYMPDAKNHTKAFVSRCNLKIEFDEDKKSISLVTPDNNSIIISDDGKSIELKDQNSNWIKLNANGITIDSAKDITISAKGKIDINALEKITAAAKSDLDLTGLNINAVADIGFSAKGNATAELAATGQTTVKGAMVMIN